MPDIIFTPPMMDDKSLLDLGEISIVSLSVILMGLSYMRITAPDTPRERAGAHLSNKRVGLEDF